MGAILDLMIPELLPRLWTSTSLIFHFKGPIDQIQVRNSPNTCLRTGLQAKDRIIRRPARSQPQERLWRSPPKHAQLYIFWWLGAFIPLSLVLPFSKRKGGALQEPPRLQAGEVFFICWKSDYGCPRNQSWQMPSLICQILA